MSDKFRMQDLGSNFLELTGINIEADEKALEMQLAEAEKKYEYEQEKIREKILVQQMEKKKKRNSQKRVHFDLSDEGDPEIKSFVKKVRRAADQCAEASVTQIFESSGFHKLVLKILAESVQAQLDKLQNSWAKLKFSQRYVYLNLSREV